MGIPTILTLILLALQLFGVITIPWLVVFLPMILELLVYLVMFVIMGRAAMRGFDRMWG